MRRIVLSLLATLAAASAKLPELDTIYYGQVRHNSTQSLVPIAAEQIVVIARLNGVTIATSSVAPGASNFVLKVPMDDGQSPRLQGTARAGERVRLFLRSNALDAEHETIESVSAGGLSVASVKGDVLATDLSVSTSLDGGGQGIALFLASHGLPAGSEAVDADGDGATNASEYAAGTNPTDGSELFRIMEVTKISGNDFIKFGPIRPSRSYTIWSSPNIGASGWSSVGQVTPGYTANYFLFGHPSPTATKLFYKLQVDAP